jgi:hypothetical protein
MSYMYVRELLALTTVILINRFVADTTYRRFSSSSKKRRNQPVSSSPYVANKPKRRRSNELTPQYRPAYRDL